MRGGVRVGHPGPQGLGRDFGERAAAPGGQFKVGECGIRGGVEAQRLGGLVAAGLGAAPGGVDPAQDASGGGGRGGAVGVKGLVGGERRLARRRGGGVRDEDESDDCGSLPD
jgi:hypothetical protein